MISIDSNAKDIAKQLDRIRRDQLPFASALALTNLAAVGMRAGRQELETTLTLRNKFSASGIQTERAEKRDWPSQTSKVGIEERRSYLIDHILGAARKPLRSPFKGVPQTNVIKRTNGGKVPTRLRPKALLQQVGRKATKRNYGGFYLIKQGDRELLFKSFAGGRGSLLAYSFTKTAKIQKRFMFERVVTLAVLRAAPEEFERAIDRALRSQR